MISRTLSKHIEKAMKKYHALSVTGPRQSGKTTLVKSLFPNYSYKNLELPDTRAFAQSDPRAFLNTAQHMIIDEIQYTPELISYIQSLIDTEPKRKFILTGSQQFAISQTISQSLAGRIHIIELLPLSISELSDHNEMRPTLPEQLISGMYPRVYNEHLSPFEWYTDYIHTYLERDVRQIKLIGDLSLFQKFMTMLAGRTGQILELSTLSSDLGVSIGTIQSWISILEATYIIFRLQPYYNNLNKRLTKAPKLHFYDTGIVCALLSIQSAKELSTHPLVGSIFESFVASEYKKKIANKTISGSLYYWREKNGKEIDMIVDEPKPKAIEVKYGQTVLPSNAKNILYYQKLLKKPIESLIIYGGNTQLTQTHYSFIPWKLM